nr:unnamed protein product [Digitaria exilis]
MEYFLMGYGLYRPPQQETSPRSTLTPMGVKLKPIKTRISLNV